MVASVVDAAEPANGRALGRWMPSVVGHQLARLHAQSARELDHGVEPGHVIAALEGADRGASHSAEVRKRFLREPSTLPRAAQLRAEVPRDRGA